MVSPVGWLWLVRAASAGVLAVPGDYATISAALSAAAPGDTIEVGPGVYDEALVVSVPVALRGTGARGDVVVVAGGFDLVVAMVTPEGSLDLSSVTLDGGYAGILANGPLTVTDVEIRGYSALPVGFGDAGGIVAYAPTVVTDTVFSGGGAAAIYAVNTDVTVDRVTVTAITSQSSAFEVTGGTFTAIDLALRSVWTSGPLISASGVRVLSIVRGSIGCGSYTPVAAVSVDDGVAVLGPLQIADTAASALVELGDGVDARLNHVTLLSPEAVDVDKFSVVSAPGAVTLDVRNSILSGPVTLGDGAITSGFNLLDPAYVDDRLATNGLLAPPSLLTLGDCADGLRVPAPGSAVVDAGDPFELDRNGTRADIGATGGPDGFVADGDGDGVASDTDCDDTDPERAPGFPEAPNDGVDQDCDGADLVDQDLDGVPAEADCDDQDPERAPGLTDLPGDGVDQDCDGVDAGTAADGIDVDGDGSLAPDDCDDSDPNVHPGAAEDVGPADLDCDGFTDPAVRFVARGCAIGARPLANLPLALLVAAAAARVQRRRRSG